jgi:RHS repeat-associated protein
LPALREQVCPETLQATATRNFHYFAVDTDADGRSEVVTENSLDSSAAAYSWRIHRAVAGCYSPTSALETPQFEGRNLDGSITHVGYAGDVGGDGRSDLVFPDWLGNRTLLLRRDPAGASGDAARSRGDQVIRITDGLGNQHAIRYRALSGWSGYTASGVNTTGTRLLLGGALSVVESYESPSGQGNGRYTVSLGYRNARISTSGRAQLTFDSIRATDSRTGLVTETLYRSDFPYAGRINRSTTWNGTQRVAESTPAWGSLRTVISAATLVQPAVAHYFVYLQGEVASGFEVDTDGGLAGSLVRTTTRQLTWNLQHGAVTTERVTVTSPLQAGASYRTTRQVTLDEGQRSAGCLGQPGRVDVTADVNGVAAPARTTQFTYDATTCRVLTQLVGPAAEPGKQVRTSLLYDVSGRVTHVTRVDGTGQLAPRETRFRYETSPFRASSEAQIIAGEPDYVTTRSWNDALGIATALTDAQGLTTTWYHDEFARLGGEFRPRGNTLTSYGSCGPCSAPGAVYAVRQLRSDGYWTETQHDSFGRVVGSLAVLADGRASRQLTEYDAFGRVARRSVPHLDGAPALYWTSYGYDLLGRPKRVTQSASEASPEGSISLLVYAGLETTRRDAELRTVTFQHDAAGRMTTVRTPLGGGATYSYDANGQLTSLADAAGHTRRLQYDARGLLVESNDPDAGRRLLGYNAYGELVQQQDAQAPVNTMTAEYDQLGRMVRRSEPEGVTTWRYSTTPGPSRGQLQQVTGPTAASATGFSESYSYGPVGWLRQTTTVIDGASYVTDRTYDAEGKVVTMTYPATVGWRPLFRLSYNLGHLVGITQENAGSTPVWTLLTMDAQGRETAARFGSGAVEERLTHDAASGRLTAIQSGLTPGARDVQHLAYQWDKVGNLVARENLGLAPQRRETFSYDELNRLTRVALNGTDTLTLSYAANGNILTKSDVGSYSYGAGAALPHAVTAIAGGPRPASSYTYDANGNLTAGAGRSLSWTSFNMPKQITLGTDYSRFSYGPGRARVRQDLKSGSTVKTVHYVGPHSEVEIEGATRRYRSNVFAYGRMVYSQLESTPSGLEGYYVLHDHAGSVDQLVRAVGAGVDRQSFAFDAWGKRRNANWSADTTDQRYQHAQFAERGYTGHEHLDHLRLVHMNGRLDDPLLGRMISPDPVLGDLADPGSLNPYSYVANNPLSFTDPSGYFLKRIGKFFKRAISGIGSFFRRVFDKWGTEIAAVVGSYYAGKAVDGWASRAGLSDVSWSYGTPGHASNGALVPGSTLTADVPAGAFLGAVIGGMVAGGISSGTLKGAALGAVGGGVSGGVASYYGGSYTAGRVITEAYIGGGTAAAHGGSFGVGASVSGGLSSLTWAALAMRRAMIAQSMLWNPESKLVNRETGEELQGPPTPSPNARGLSAGFRFDFFKLGGSRFPSTNSVLGGFQGGRGNVFGIGYGPGSFLDGLVETYAGPHDFLNSPLFYDSFGNNQKRFWAWEVVNAANVLVATPFAAASVVPPSAYGTLAGP